MKIEENINIKESESKMRRKLEERSKLDHKLKHGSHPQGR